MVSSRHDTSSATSSVAWSGKFTSELDDETHQPASSRLLPLKHMTRIIFDAKFEFPLISPPAIQKDSHVSTLSVRMPPGLSCMTRPNLDCAVIMLAHSREVARTLEMFVDWSIFLIFKQNQQQVDVLAGLGCNLEPLNDSISPWIEGRFVFEVYEILFSRDNCQSPSMWTVTIKSSFLQSDG